MEVKKQNPWLVHLKAYAAEHKEMSYTECMKAAKLTYKKVEKEVKEE